MADIRFCLILFTFRALATVCMYIVSETLDFFIQPRRFRTLNYLQQTDWRSPAVKLCQGRRTSATDQHPSISDNTKVTTAPGGDLA